MNSKINKKLTLLLETRDNLLNEIEQLKGLLESKHTEYLLLTGSIKTLQELSVEISEEKDDKDK